MMKIVESQLLEGKTQVLDNHYVKMVHREGAALSSTRDCGGQACYIESLVGRTNAWRQCSGPLHLNYKLWLSGLEARNVY